MPDTNTKHYLMNACHVCKKINTEFSCGICKMIFYCCEQHRREDWPVHSHLCRAINKMCIAKGNNVLYESVVDGTPEQYRQIRHKTAMDCSKIIGRNLMSYELEILYWPKICGVCYRQTSQLDSCHKCQFVFTCSGSHQISNHDEWCSSLRLYQDILLLSEISGLPSIPVLEIPKKFTSMKDILIWQGLVNIGKEESEKVVVHLIGAELQAEVLPFYKWENYLLHVLPACAKLTLVFVGPDLTVPDALAPVGKLPLCQKCRDAEKSLNYEIVANRLYHEYETSEVTADLAVAMNAGIYRSFGFNGQDTWAPTLNKLFCEDTTRERTPVMVTEYTSCESAQGLKIMTTRYPHVKVLQPPQLNQFAALRPNLNIISDDAIPVIFKNYYYTLLSA